MEKLEQLESLLRAMGGCLVAYSGGVDSAFLACVAHRVLGEASVAVLADSPSLPRSELNEAVALAERFGFPLEVIKTLEFENEAYLTNPPNRCYFCKHALFEAMEALAAARGVPFLLYGENMDDLGDVRPGAQAAAQFQVRAPLKEAGLTKAEIRALSAHLGLPTADKPQMACLSSRIPHGERVTPAKLTQIEQAEQHLRSLGFHDVRVRHHELSQGALARIEIGPDEMSRCMEWATRQQLVEKFQALGYQQVTLDLIGYRRGSLNPSSSNSIARDQQA
ncbi:MAG: ATP-dependent sacrificial sulfur transferase LarE [Verrucomicrobia bacterium]|nr:ATP-dependent sacrificial sulfur transferase LarE [Verrucomicrobiota bacterium]